MAQIIEFPQNRSVSPSPSSSLAGHVVMLNPERPPRRWQCGGFFLSSRTPMTVVEERAQMDVIQRGLDAGELVDVTDRPELWVKPKDPGSYTVEDTGLKTYSGTRAFFRSCGIDDCPSARDEDQVVYSTGDPEEQEQIEEALRSVPVHKAAPLTTQGIHLTRKVNGPVGLVLPPGMDDPERYLLR